MMGDEEGSVDMDMEHADEMLNRLLHLKKYEVPEDGRMSRNQQNIMRRVRQTTHRDWSLSDLLEINIPWLFAEPRYGIALMFIVFAGLQFWGTMGQKHSQESSYAASQLAAVGRVPEAKAASTNNFKYPELPAGMKFFPDRAGDGGSVRFVGLEEE